MDVHMSYSDYQKMWEDAFPVYAVLFGIGLAALLYEKVDDYLTTRKAAKMTTKQMNEKFGNL